MPTVGTGVQEIRIRDGQRTYRVFYVAKFQEAVYVLHVFQKQSRKTAETDLKLAKARNAGLLMWRKEQGL